MNKFNIRANGNLKITRPYSVENDEHFIAGGKVRQIVDFDDKPIPCIRQASFSKVEANKLCFALNNAIEKETDLDTAIYKSGV